MSKFKETLYGPVRVVEVKDEDQPLRYYFEVYGRDAMGAAKWDKLPERGNLVLIDRHYLAEFHEHARPANASAELLEILAATESAIRDLAPKCRQANRTALDKIAANLGKAVNEAILSTGEEVDGDDCFDPWKPKSSEPELGSTNLQRQGAKS